MSSQLEKARWFWDRHSHNQPGMLVLPNAWDPGSAVMMVEAGFPAIATTSAGMAFALGMPDGECIARHRMLELCREIARAVQAPVTADLEAGYGPRPEDVSDTVQGAIDVGLVGCNIEDGSGDRNKPLFELAHACERIRAGAEAVRQSGIPFVLNARVDCYLLRPEPIHDDENFAEAVRRANAYREAGAGCVYVPGPLDGNTIGRLVREIHAPLNILGARAGRVSMRAADLEQLGVKRVTIGGSLSLAVLKYVQDAAKEILEQGTFSFAKSAISNAYINRLMQSVQEMRATQPRGASEWASSTQN